MSRLISSKVSVVFAVSWLFCSCSDGYINLNVLGFDDSSSKGASNQVVAASGQASATVDAGRDAHASRSRGECAPPDDPQCEDDREDRFDSGTGDLGRSWTIDGDWFGVDGGEDFDPFGDDWGGIDSVEELDPFGDAWAGVDSFDDAWAGVEDHAFFDSNDGVDDGAWLGVEDHAFFESDDMGDVVVGVEEGVVVDDAVGGSAESDGNGGTSSDASKSAAATGEGSNAKLGEPSEAIAAEFVPNLHKVSDVLYRSAYPREGGLAEIESLGIRSVLELSYLDTDSALIEAQTTSLRLVHYPMLPVAIEQSQIVELFKIYEELDKPVLVHCFHGADRTGLFVAIYRILYQNWTKDDAKDELVNGGYGYHEVFGDVVIAVDELDVDALRASVVGKSTNGGVFER